MDADDVQLTTRRRAYNNGVLYVVVMRLSVRLSVRNDPVSCQDS